MVMDGQLNSSEQGASPRVVSKSDLFLGFLKIGMLGFGGIAPWARHIIIEERCWLTEKEFAAILGVGQILPGPNTMNAAVMIGDRFQGLAGVLLCLLGQMLVPLFVVTALGVIYTQYADAPWVNAAVVGAAAGAAGLVMGTGLKMARKAKPTPLAILVAGAAFGAVGIIQWPLVPVVAALVPISITATALERRP
jgi:chromate transporter